MEQSMGFLQVIWGVFLLLALLTVLSGFFTVDTQTAAIVQRFGRFMRVAGPDLNFKTPWIENVVARLDLRVQQHDVQVETKTKDNVFVKIPVAVQYHVLPDKVYEAFYRLSLPQQQIESYVFNVVLGHVPKMNLDEAFEQQSSIALVVKQELDEVMAGFGYGIVKALVTDIIPDDKVKLAMNDINAAQREQVAANARGEAEKILKVKQAEAEAASKALQGKGIADQRKAIIDGLRESVEALSAGRGRVKRQGRDGHGPHDTIFRYAERNRRFGEEQYHHDAALAGWSERLFRPASQLVYRGFRAPVGSGRSDAGT